jgi:hypothetical protein
VLKTRRGVLAAGLAVAVVGAIGAASTLTAGAEQIPDSASAPQPAAATAVPTPPSLLPWGQRPQRIKRGAAGTTSRTLRAEGLAAAANDTSGSTQPRGRYAPKGLSEKNTVLRSQVTDIKPPEPPGPPQPSDPASSSEDPDPVVPEQTPPSIEPPSTDSAADPGSPPATTDPGADPGTDPVSPPATTDAAAHPSPAPTPSASTSASTVNYLYNVGRQEAITTGFYANVTIGKPTLAKADYHSLAELAVQSGDGKQAQAVEVGWTVDRLVNGDDDPHLFVYHWVNGVGTCYNGCGFVQYSSTIKPGDTLAYGVTKKISIQYAGAAWWVAFDTEWVGYFPEKLWLDQGVSSFATSGLVQVFGEVAAASTTPCDTQMGNGVSSSDAASALIGSVTFLNGPAVALGIRSTTDVYPVAALSGRTFRFGGSAAACPKT